MTEGEIITALEKMDDEARERVLVFARSRWPAKAAQGLPPLGPQIVPFPFPVQPYDPCPQGPIWIGDPLYPFITCCGSIPSGTTHTVATTHTFVEPPS